MNRANVLIAAIALAALFVAGRAQTQTQPAGPIGRYQLQVVEHAVTVSTASSGASVTVRDVLRVDTATGETDVWRNGVDRTGQAFNTWSPIR